VSDDERIVKERAQYDAIYSQDYGGRTPEGSHGWIQWKGTDVCIDVRCACGHSGHIDGDFFYYYRCPSCQALYAVGQNIKLIALTAEQAADAERRSEGAIHSDD
jgi:hypothetical protein